MTLALILLLHLTGFDAIAYRLAGCHFITYPVASETGDVYAIKWVCS